MIHPNTELRHISPEMGYGVFATDFIPKGTIVYVKDALEVEVHTNDYLQHDPSLQEVIEKYSYIDERGVRILSWDLAKYVNHCCNCNTMSTGYGFEIAIRDIQPGEEITDEYGLFNLEQPMILQCANPLCRRMVCAEDVDHRFREWDDQIRRALAHLFRVEQPLFTFLEASMKRALSTLEKDPNSYRSVLALKYQPSNHITIR